MAQRFLSKYNLFKEHKTIRLRSLTMRNYKIAAIPADGIGTEVIAAGVSVLETLQKIGRCHFPD
jgi:hypothetical protein